ncbi:MAG TPA: hypothetical protein VGR62_03995 [Candidatus Binatia bacterium]|nr:hypothetical protein [Candidatus Binatia bacterium]
MSTARAFGYKLDPVLARPPVTLAVLGAAALLLLGEGIARLAGDRVCSGAPGQVYQADPAVGWTYVPNLRARVGRCDNAPLPPTRLETDARGLPLPGAVMPKPPDTVRVLLLGGMSADGIGVRPAHTLARRLADLADTRRGPRLDVVNLSMAGYTLDNDLLLWRDAGAAMDPDVVLVMLDPAGELVSISPPLLGAQGRNAPAKPWITLQNDRLVVSPAPPLLPATPAATGLAAHLQLLRLFQGVPLRTGPPLGFAPTPAPTDDQLPQEHTRARALVRALLEALRDETAARGAKLGILLAPIPGEWQSGTRAPARDWLATTTSELGIPLLDLRDTIGYADVNERPMFAPGSMRWSAAGHMTAALTMFQFLREKHLVPDTMTFTTGAFALPTMAEVPDRLWAVRDGPLGRLIVWGLVAVALVWASAAFSATVRDWVLVVASLGMVAMVAEPAMALAALTVVLAHYIAVELLPRWLGRPLSWLVMMAPIAAILAPDPMPQTGVYFDERLFPTMATMLLILRLASYGADRRAGAPACSLRHYLAATLFFPTVGITPVLSPSEWVRRRGAGLVAVPTRDALRLHLRRSAVALARLVVGSLKVTLAPLLLGLITPDVFLGAAGGVSFPRLWLWVLELPLLLYLVLSGMADLGIGLAALVGMVLPEEFDAPWRITGPITLWRRANASLAAMCRRLVYLPLGGHERHAARNLVLAFVAGGIWWLVGMVLFSGAYFYPPRLWPMPVATALVFALGVLVARSRATPPPSGAGTQALRVAATYVFVGVASIPLFVPAWQGPAALGRVLLRLVFPFVH